MICILVIFGFDVFMFYVLYMLGGDIMFMCLVFIYIYIYIFFFFVSCFTYDTLIIDLYYEVIHGICHFIFCEIKKLI